MPTSESSVNQIQKRLVRFDRRHKTLMKQQTSESCPQWDQYIGWRQPDSTVLKLSFEVNHQHLQLNHIEYNRNISQGRFIMKMWAQLRNRILPWALIFFSPLPQDNRLHRCQLGGRGLHMQWRSRAAFPVCRCAQVTWRDWKPWRPQVAVHCVHGPMCQWRAQASVEQFLRELGLHTHTRTHTPECFWQHGEPFLCVRVSFTDACGISVLCGVPTSYVNYWFAVHFMISIFTSGVRCTSWRGLWWHWCLDSKHVVAVWPHWDPRIDRDTKRAITSKLSF